LVLVEHRQDRFPVDDSVRKHVRILPRSVTPHTSYPQPVLHPQGQAHNMIGSCAVRIMVTRHK
ncbi:hypothetical protein, partial [Mycobacterium aquaticum]|uniref:hypothetical protein n=1 Tax=Mycobacterium aquaticum TaxID=1927124 RepID=UPI001B804690